MWPWFRWMSTSHLYSSNQQSLTETHAHTQSHWLSHSFSLLCSLCQQCSLRSWDEWETEKQRERERGGGGVEWETPDAGEIYSHTRLFTPRQQSESQWSWHQLRGARSPRSFPSLPGRSGVTGPQTPDLQAPPAPCTSRAEQVLNVAARDFKGAGWRQYAERWGAQVGRKVAQGPVKTDKGRFIFPQGIFQILIVHAQIQHTACNNAVSREEANTNYISLMEIYLYNMQVCCKYREA